MMENLFQVKIELSARPSGPPGFEGPKRSRFKLVRLSKFIFNIFVKTLSMQQICCQVFQKTVHFVQRTRGTAYTQLVNNLYYFQKMNTCIWYIQSQLLFHSSFFQSYVKTGKPPNILNQGHLQMLHDDAAAVPSAGFQQTVFMLQ